MENAIAQVLAAMSCVPFAKVGHRNVSANLDQVRALATTSFARHTWSATVARNMDHAAQLLRQRNDAIHGIWLSAEHSRGNGRRSAFWQRKGEPAVNLDWSLVELNELGDEIEMAAFMILWDLWCVERDHDPDNQHPR